MRTTITSIFSLRPLQAAAQRLRDGEAVPPWADSMDFDAVNARDRWVNGDDTVERAMAQMDDTPRDASTAEH